MKRAATLILSLLAFGCANLQNATSPQTVTPAEAKALISKAEGPTVIDLRTAEEFTQGHIKGARNIDFKSPGFRDKLAQLNPDKPYLFHCRSGSRSTKSIPVWKDLGFKNLYHLDSGILGWKQAGLPTTTE